MKYYTMKEVQDILGISRNTIYTYLKRGVVNTPIAKNRKGHLLFDDHQLSLLQGYKGIDDKTPVEFITYTELEEVKQELPKPQKPLEEEGCESTIKLKSKSGVKLPFKSSKDKWE